MPNHDDLTAHIGWTAESLERHLADKERARARREHRDQDPDRGQRKPRHNRAAAKAAWKREVRV